MATFNNMDDFFESIYGFKPHKRGAGYELLVGAVLKILNTDSEVTNNVFVKSNYSDDRYQVDNLIDNQIFVEVKDYEMKVGRPDVTKLSGALLHLPLDKGIVATAKDFTGPAVQYSKDCLANPNAKPIDLYIIRPSTEKDTEGTIRKIHIKMSFIVNDYANAKIEPKFAKEAAQIFTSMGLKDGDQLDYGLEGFYRKDGSVIKTLWELTNDLKPKKDAQEIIGNWEFSEPTHIYVNERLIPIEYMHYEVPIKTIERDMVIDAGKPLIYVQSIDGSIDRVINEDQLKKIKFEKSNRGVL